MCWPSRTKVPYPVVVGCKQATLNFPTTGSACAQTQTTFQSAMGCDDAKMSVPEPFENDLKTNSGKMASIEPLRPGILMNWASGAYKPTMARKLREQSEKILTEGLNGSNLSRDVLEAIERSLMLDVDESLPSSLTQNEHRGFMAASNSFVGVSYRNHLTADTLEKNYNLIAERIWRLNDQNASLFLQERLRRAVPEEFVKIIKVINHHIDALMIHRFGNFLVQCMLELARPEEVAQFAHHLTGSVSKMAQHQFCCHVIQKLLDVSPLVIQARLAAELLDDAVATMSSQFGTHVWQKLLHLPWSPELPPITILINNAVHLESKHNGWVAIAQTEGGCATIKSYLSLPQTDAGRLECIDELLASLSLLIKQASGSQVICKLCMMGSTRARTMTLIFSKALEYCRHPTASGAISHLLKLKIPSFPARLRAAIAPYYTTLSRDKHGMVVISLLERVQSER